MRFRSENGTIYTLEEKQTTQGDNYCLRSHHLAPIRTCYGKTKTEVLEKALEEGLEQF